jgi:VWFA-related protein
MTTMLMRPNVRLSLALVSLVLLNLPVHGQDGGVQSVSTMSVDVKVVTLPVTVRDKKGQIVRNLTKDDFVLQEDGRPQVIKYFAQQTNLPLTLGLLVDTSLSQRNVLDQERNASKVFLDQMLTDAKDKAFLIHFDREVELLQDLTSSREKLQAGLELLRTPQPDRDTSSNDPRGSDPQSSPGSGNGQPRMHQGGGTLLYDAIYLASNELMKKQQGRKALIVLTDGDDRGSKESLQSAIEAAQRADTVVYSILFADNHRDSGGFGFPGGGGGMGRRGGGWPGGGGSGGGGRGGGRNPQEPHVDGKKILEQISKETGGRLYEVSKKQAMDQIYDSIAEELRTQYNLGYTPDKGNAEAGYHKITLTAKQKDLVVQTRDGYYAER